MKNYFYAEHDFNPIRYDRIYQQRLERQARGNFTVHQGLFWATGNRISPVLKEALHEKGSDCGLGDRFGQEKTSDVKNQDYPGFLIGTRSFGSGSESAPKKKRQYPKYDENPKNGLGNSDGCPGDSAKTKHSSN